MVRILLTFIFAPEKKLRALGLRLRALVLQPTAGSSSHKNSKIMSKKITELLGDKAEYLLDHKSKSILKDSYICRALILLSRL